MVHAVVRGRVEHLLDPAEFAHRLGVHEKLETQVDRHHRDDVRRRKPQPGQRQPEQPHARDRIGQALPERRGQVQPLRRVVHHVRGPHPADAVVGTMEEVVEKILRQEQQRDRPPRSRQLEQPELVHPPVQADHRRPGQRVGALVHQRQRGIAQGVAQAVDVAALALPVPGFPDHKPQEYRRHRQQDPLAHRRPRPGVCPAPVWTMSPPDLQSDFGHAETFSADRRRRCPARRANAPCSSGSDAWRGP